MREIKFKAERFGQIFDVLEWNFTGHPDRQDILLGKDGKEAIRESIKNLNLMQFTGLTDKNGKEIYEGDIISGCYYDDKVAVEWNNEDAGWYPFSKPAYGGYEFEGDDPKRVEVTGNIYENPELLKNE